MIKIQSLLNPLSEASLGRHSPPPSPHLSDIHRQKVSKTAAVFVKGEPKGEVRYPPHEIDDDDDLAAELLKYRITPTPLRDIKKYPRHIPYNSDKKSFLAKTGREAFEVFQYTYKVPGDSTDYVVMWDYNIGLTRITPFFKSCKYPKTTPAKALRINSGLGAISYSITGGALAAQGYWMPFEAAKAVAATFCYPIRHALTPIFGREFVDMCMLPSEASYASFKIRDDIVRSSTQQTEQWRSFYSTPQSDHAPSPTPLGSPLDIPRSSSATGPESFSPWSPASSRPLRRAVTRSVLHSSRTQQHCLDLHRTSKRRAIGSSSSRNANDARHSNRTPASDTDDEPSASRASHPSYTISPQVSPKGQTFLWFSADGAPYTPAPTPRARTTAATSAGRDDTMAISHVVSHSAEDMDDVDDHHHQHHHGAVCGSPVSTLSMATATTAGSGTPTSAASPRLHGGWYSFVPRSCWSDADELAAANTNANANAAAAAMAKGPPQHRPGAHRHLHHGGGIPTSHHVDASPSPRLLPATMLLAGAGSKRKVSDSQSQSRAASIADDGAAMAAMPLLLMGHSPDDVRAQRGCQNGGGGGVVRPRGAPLGKGTDMEAALTLIAMASGGEEDDDDEDDEEEEVVVEEDDVDGARCRKSRRVS